MGLFLCMGLIENKMIKIWTVYFKLFIIERSVSYDNKEKNR